MRSGLERPRFAYIAPTYRMGKAIAWDYLKHYAAPVDGVTVNESELRLDFGMNGAQVRIYGADNPDALRGIYLDGCVLDEYGLMDASLFGEVIRPLLADRKGWAFFIGTPNGKNQFYDVVQTAKSSKDWFFAEYKASATHLLDPQREINKRRSALVDNIIRGTNTGWVYTDKLTPDQKALIKNHGAKPGINIEFPEGAQEPHRLQPSPFPQGMAELEAKGLEDLREISGINESALGELDAAQSGRAIEARQRQAV